MWQNTEINSIPTCTCSLLSSLELRLYFTCQSSKIIPKFKNTFFLSFLPSPMQYWEADCLFIFTQNKWKPFMAFICRFLTCYLIWLLKVSFETVNDLKETCSIKLYTLRDGKKCTDACKRQEFGVILFDIFRGMFSTLHSSGIEGTAKQRL